MQTSLFSFFKKKDNTEEKKKNIKKDLYKTENLKTPTPEDDNKSIKDNSSSRKSLDSSLKKKLDDKITYNSPYLIDDDDDEEENEFEIHDNDDDDDYVPDDNMDQDDDDDEDFYLVDEEDEEEFVFDDDDDDDYIEKPKKRKRLNKGNTKKKRQKIGKMELKEIKGTSQKKIPSHNNNVSDIAFNDFTATPTSTTSLTPLSVSSSKLNKSISKKYNNNNKNNNNDDESINLTPGALPGGLHEHNNLKFLKPENRRDAKGHRPDDPKYNPRSLYVPEDFLKKQTPAQKQWWIWKSRGGNEDNKNNDGLMDTILFFKVGKFYELFNMDADIGVKELDLIYMKGTKAHSGFPEIAYGKYSDLLVEKGYRVARIEQTEKPEDMKKRKPKDKVVRRELCSIKSRGTRTYCFLDQSFSAKSTIASRLYNVLLAIKVRKINNDQISGSISQPVYEYGICMVDSPTGQFFFGQFADNSQHFRLRTLLSQYSPVEILIEKEQKNDDDNDIKQSKISYQSLEDVIRERCPTAVLDLLLPNIEYWNNDKTIKEIKKAKYFDEHNNNQNNNDMNIDNDDDMKNWPDILKALIEGGDSSSLALSAFGAIIFYLRRAIIDFDLISLKKFVPYIPPDDLDDNNNKNNNINENENKMEDNNNKSNNIFKNIPNNNIENQLNNNNDTSKRLILDSISLLNLEILQNTYDGSENGTLWSFMDCTNTSFGKRLLKDWICHPLININQINERLDAVEELMSTLTPEADATRNILKQLPDIQRLLSRTHTLSTIHHSYDHPDSRAIMYEDEKYNHRKIKDFCRLIEGVTIAKDIIDIFKDETISSPLLNIILKDSNNNGLFPQYNHILEYFKNAFDMKLAKKNGYITPKQGVDEEYDNALEQLNIIKNNFSQYLNEQAKRLQCTSIKYWGKGKDRYQIELPERIANHNLPREYETKSKKKGYKRFWTPWIIENTVLLNEAEERLEIAKNDYMRKLFEYFVKNMNIWEILLQCLSRIDCLLSLAKISSQLNYCKPSFINNNENELPILNIKNGRHPCIEEMLSKRGITFISNDTILGTKENPSMMLLSGPNMGGKSTLLRQVCVIVIMAQIGCFVPAESCQLTPVDRVFTRIGASDHILAGQSTFFVELSETSNILHNATRNSLIILDELGRGTATFDGTAIAHSVVDYLVDKINARALFATHYHSLVDEWGNDNRVQLGHMDCIVEPNSNEQNVTFLYRLKQGSSPKSYGINVARLARLPKEVINLAAKKSQEFEESLIFNTISRNDLLIILEDEKLTKEEKYNKLLELKRNLLN